MPTRRPAMRFAFMLFALTGLSAHVEAQMPSPVESTRAAPSPARDAAKAAASALPESIDARIRRHMADGALVGIGAAIILDGTLAWSAGYGSADRQSGTPFTADTVMNIGSISKTVVGAAMLRAAEQGRLSLDADIRRWLPFTLADPHRRSRPITLRDLATHTAGIVDREDAYARSYHFGGDAPESLGDFLAAYLAAGGREYSPQNFIAARPGTHREYSNIGAGLAGYVVERATGMPLNDYTRAQFFVPLGMTRTHWRMAESPNADRARLYVVDDGMALPIEPYGLATWPDGGLRTSVRDLSRFFIALLGDGTSGGVRVLSRDSVAQMRRFQYTARNRPDNVDLAEKNSGLFWSTKMNLAYVGHGGRDPGVRTDMLATPTLDTGVILFSNTAGTGTDKAYLEILKALLAEASALHAARGGERK